VTNHLEEGRLMGTRLAIANRIRALCQERGITPNRLSTVSAVPQATIKSILNGESKNPGTVTIKKLCDGFEITLGEFFSTPEFDDLEQEIK
jgi:transcriptional regulator with XRE-family HTH domain